MRTDIARWLTGILGAWLVSLGLIFTAPASTAASPPQSTTGVAHQVQEPALCAPLRNALGDDDRDSVLDDQDPPESEAPPLSGAGNAQAFAPAGEVQFRRLALPAPIYCPDSISRVEPRFLRYSRLLN